MSLEAKLKKLSELLEEAEELASEMYMGAEEAEATAERKAMCDLWKTIKL